MTPKEIERGEFVCHLDIAFNGVLAEMTEERKGKFKLSWLEMLDLEAASRAVAILRGYFGESVFEVQPPVAVSLDKPGDFNRIMTNTKLDMLYLHDGHFNLENITRLDKATASYVVRRLREKYGESAMKYCGPVQLLTHHYICAEISKE